MEDAFPDLEIPKYIDIGNVTYTVYWDEQHYNAMAVEVNGQAEGFCKPKDGLIVINPDQCEDQFIDSLAHEVEHAILAFSGVTPDNREGMDQEEWISRTNSIRIDVYRRNPTLRNLVFGWK